MYALTIPLFLIPFAFALCPPTGPVLPPPSISESFDFSNLKNTLDQLSTGQVSKINATTNSFSVQVSSLDDTIFDYHHTAPVRNESGVSIVDSQTVYRIASVTKTFTVLATILEAGLSLDRPISKYVPELKGSEWSQVTLRLLGSQLAGVPRDNSAFDEITQSAELIPLGFPIPPPSANQTCGIGGITPDCTRQEFFKGLLKDKSLWSPADKAAYSDLAYILLGYALENITGKPYEVIVRDKILQPLGLNSSGFIQPLISRAIVPDGMDFFSLDFGNYNAAAGMFSTPADTSKYLRSILQNKLLSPMRTREWLKPLVFTSSLYSAVGMPWEIYRYPTPTPYIRPVDLYVKSGDFPGYAAYAVLIPEYNVAVSINTAGDQAFDVSAQLLDDLAIVLIPALESITRSQSQRKYAGDYRSNDPSNDASLTLAVDSGPGLKISKWTNLGKDMLFAFETVLFGAPSTNKTSIDARIYPIGSAGRWRVQLESPGGGNGTNLSGLACESWTKVGQFRYAGLAVDEVDFKEDGTGVVQSVALPGIRVELQKV